MKDNKRRIGWMGSLFPFAERRGRRRAGMVVAILGFAAMGALASPVVNIDFNGGGDPTESTAAGVLGPGLTDWEGVAPGVGTKGPFDTAGPLFNSRLSVNVIRASSDSGAWPGSPDLFDGLTDPERVIVDLEDLVPGETYTLAVYAGSVIQPGFRIRVQGQAKFQGISSGTLPGLEDQDYSLFRGVRADSQGTIRVIVEESAPSLSAFLCAIQIAGPFLGASPDAAIGTRPSSLRGRDRVSRTGRGQTVKATFRNSRKKRFYVESGFLHFLTTGRFLIEGRRSDRLWRVAYFDTTSGRANITSGVVSDGHMTDALYRERSPMSMQIEIRPTRRGLKSRKPFQADLLFRNGSLPSSMDRVQATVRSR